MDQDRIWDYYQNEGLAHAGFFDARQRFLLKQLAPHQRVLDIGVGSGSLERMAQQKGVDIHALDPSERAVERLRGDLGLGGKARCGYSQAIPFNDGQFDIVVMSEVLEHLDDEVLAASLDEVVRVLRPGGVLLATTPYREELEFSAVVCPCCSTVFHRYGHVQSFDKARMHEVVARAGLTVDKMFVTAFVDWRRKGVVNMLKSAVRWTLGQLGESMADPHLVVNASKPSLTA